MPPIKSPKKLIEVALPLDKINAEAALRKRKAPGGYPTTLHKWWAQRPVAVARAITFAQMVNDPGYQQGGGFKYGVNKERATIERDRLFRIIEDLVLWENTNNEAVLSAARQEILRSWRETCDLNKSHPDAAELFDPDRLPPFHDPFCGSGALPLEAQRLGLNAFGSDLNPVAVTITKAMIEVPAKFSGQEPVGPKTSADKQSKLHHDWSGAKGLAEDVRRYGAWMCAEALRRIGHLYPRAEITEKIVDDPGFLRPDLASLKGKSLPVIAWLWVRTVRSPNPAFSHVDVPLASSFILCSKEGKQAYVAPVIDGDSYRFTVRMGVPPDGAANGTKLSRGANFRCILSDVPIDPKYIKAEGMAGRMGARLMAIIADGPKSRVFLPPSDVQEATALGAVADWRPDVPLPDDPRNFWTLNYGLSKFSDLFTSRQLVVLNTFTELLAEAAELCLRDATAAGLPNDSRGLQVGATGAKAYSEAIALYLTCALSRLADYGCSLATWRPKDNAMRSGMPKQAIQMSWDFAEGSPFASSSSGFVECAEVVAKVLETSLNLGQPGLAYQASAASDTSRRMPSPPVVSTDPPYFDNISYADLSDFLYMWMRRSLRSVFPDLYATLAVPKAEELVASPYRHGSRLEAEAFFLNGMRASISALVKHSHPAFPVTIYYAFKQAETIDGEGTHSTGWETFLTAVLQAGFSITGTWPVRTEGDNRQVGVGNNVLASSIVLVCRRRGPEASTISRREFIRELNAALPEALLDMTHGGVNSPVAPVDLSQAIIGPGMAIFSQYASVLEADGKPMGVRGALQLINRFLSEDDFDGDTQFCLHWFEAVGWAIGKYGEADVLARAKGTSVGGLTTAGVLESNGGQVRLFRWREYPTDWSPEDDQRKAVWEMLHHLIRALNGEGESSAGSLLARMMDKAEPIRALAYRLYTLCERKGWADDARAYNELITSWQSIETAATDAGPRGTQVKLDI